MSVWSSERLPRYREFNPSAVTWAGVRNMPEMHVRCVERRWFVDYCWGRRLSTQPRTRKHPRFGRVPIGHRLCLSRRSCFLQFSMLGSAMTVPQRIAAQVDSVPSAWSARPIRSDIPAERVVGAEFSAQRIEPDLVWIDVRGEIDIRNAHALHAFTHRQLEESIRMVVDLGAVEFFGAAGLSVFDDLDERARALNVRWALLSGRPVERLLRVADAAIAAKACRTREAALAAVAPVM